MQSPKLSEWLSILANVGVLIGIFLLIAEVNHASRLSEAEGHQVRTKDIQELNLQLALSESLADVFVNEKTGGIESLTPSEFLRAQAWYSAVLRGMQGQYYQYQQGFLDRASIDHTLDDINEEFYQKWETYGLLRLIESEEWLKEIEQRLSKHSGVNSSNK